MSLSTVEQHVSVDFVFDGLLSKSPPRIRRQETPAPALECPRCRSINTKFCYYNNYNKSQPRHFCKSCKRHWTKGGILRNLPVGGGRKNKRQKKKSSIRADSNSNSSQMGTQRQSLDPLFLSNQNDNLGQSLIIPSPSSTVQVDPMNIDNINLGSFSFGSCLMGFSESTSINNPSSSDVSYNVYEEDSKMGLIMPTTSNFMDMQKYCWNLEDIDTLVSSHELNIP